MVEVGCKAHAGHHVHQALDSDPSRYARCCSWSRGRTVWSWRGNRAWHGRTVREQSARPALEKLRGYFLGIREELLPKSEAGQA